MFDELLAQPGVEEEVVLRSRFGFMAFHGGSLEEQTDVIAETAAGDAGASCYSVRLPPDLRWHVPSTQVDPARSSALASFLDHVEVAVAVHGYGRFGRWTDLLLGGRNRVLADHLATHLAPRLPDYRIVVDMDDIPSELRGQHPDNPVNRPASAGVQLELPPRVRGQGPRWAGFEGDVVPPMRALVDGLVEAARSWPVAPTQTN